MPCSHPTRSILPRCGLVAAIALMATPVNAGGFTSNIVNLNALEQSIKDVLDDNVVGYGYAIARNGKIRRQGAGGWAQRPNDGNKPMRARTRINVMSATKTWSAVAVLQLLEQRGLTIDEKISKWLPKNWFLRGPGFRNSDSLTFRQLLTHTSGLNQKFQELKAAGEHGPWSNAWDGIKFVVRKGTHDDKSASYKNMNFALLRVLIPRLAGHTFVRKWNYSDQYVKYMRQNVALPAGVTLLTCKRIGFRPHANAYDLNDPTSPGALAEGSMSDCGGHSNFQLSAKELAKFMTALRCRGESSPLLSKANCERMNEFKLGWQSSSNQGSYTGIFRHGGDRVGKNQIHTCQMIIEPGNVEIGLITNSKSANGWSACGMLRVAYENAQ